MICSCGRLLRPKGQFWAAPGRFNGRRKPKLSARPQQSFHYLTASAQHPRTWDRDWDWRIDQSEAGRRADELLPPWWIRQHQVEGRPVAEVGGLIGGRWLRRVRPRSLIACGQIWFFNWRAFWAAAKLSHGTGQTTDLPRLRGLFDSSAASRRQRPAHVPVPRMRWPRPAENRWDHRLAEGRATATKIGPRRLLICFLYIWPGTESRFARDVLGGIIARGKCDARKADQVPVRERYRRSLPRYHRYQRQRAGRDGARCRVSQCWPVLSPTMARFSSGPIWPRLV